MIEALNGTKKLIDIPGVYFREKGKIKIGKKSKLIKDLDSLPFPARHLVDKYEYGKVKNVYFRKPKFTSIITSRGCPFHCKFCTRDFETIKTYRKRTVKNVIIMNPYHQVLK